MASFDLSSNGFHLGAWDPKTLTFSQGEEKIEALDQWYFKLNQTDRKKFVSDYILNRNRLFLVTQEKRLKESIHSLDAPDLAKTTRTPWLKMSAHDLQVAQKARLEVAEESIKSDLSNEPVLRSRLFQSLADTNPTSALYGLNRDSSEGMHVTKSMGGGLGGFYSLGGGRSWDSAQREDPEVRAQKAAATTALDNAADRKKIVEEKEPVCKPLEKRENAAKFLNSSLYPKEAKFLAALGIAKINPSKTQNDLSAWYDQPRSQGRVGSMSAKCAGFAVTADARATLIHTGKNSDPPALSPDHLYDVAVVTEAGARKLNSDDPDYCKLTSYKEVDPHQGVSMEMALTHLGKTPFCSADGKTKYVVKSFASLQVRDDKKAIYEKPKINAEFIRALIDSNQPPIAKIDSDDRSELEDHILPEPWGQYQHVINIIGYGEGVSPKTLCKERYFLIRDSLGQKTMHYKISEAELLSHLDALYKTTDVEEPNPPLSWSSLLHRTGIIK